MEESNFHSINKNRKLTPIDFEIKEEYVKIGKRELLRRNIIGVHHEISKNPDDKFSFLKFFYYPLDLQPKRCITKNREIFSVAVFDKLKSRLGEIRNSRIVSIFVDKRMKNTQKNS